jgi:hypothetical protein
MAKVLSDLSSVRFPEGVSYVSCDFNDTLISCPAIKIAEEEFTVFN